MGEVRTGVGYVRLGLCRLRQVRLGYLRLCCVRLGLVVHSFG